MAAKVLNGKVVKLSGDKTVKVSVETMVRHPIYRKSITRTRNFLCHNEMENVGVGCKVEITECRPYSKLKSWKVSKLMGV